MILDHFIVHFSFRLAFEIRYFYRFKKCFRIYGEDCSPADHVHDAGFDSCVVSQGTKTPAKLDARHLCFG
jgi:hypothetical protein